MRYITTSFEKSYFFNGMKYYKTVNTAKMTFLWGKHFSIKCIFPYSKFCLAF